MACFNKELTQMGMNMCAGREFERADRDLNLEWAKAKGWAKDDPQTSRLLLRSQRAWLKYRDAQCELMADEDRGGSIAPLEQGKCLTGMTRERTEALANFAKPLDQQ
ncbi:MAG TPA: lysozyme inhibitor LprI family protein [Sphingomicrobium sp.]|nr:lysozyme inhibitor LprI family protein [Sphingomicrobium sp.]